MFSPGIRESILNYLEKEPPGVVALDFDNTQILGDLGETCLWHLATREGLSLNHSILAGFQTRREPDILLGGARREPDPGHALYQRCRDLWPELSENPDWRIVTRDEEIARLALTEYALILDELGSQVAYPWSIALFAGRPPEEFRQISARVVAEPAYQELSSQQLAGLPFTVGFQPLRAWRELCRDIHQMGHEIFVITASPTELIREFYRRHTDYTIAPERVFGMEAAQNANDLMEPWLESIMTWGPGKVEVLERVAGTGPGKDKKLLLAAGDSRTDWELLQAANKALYIHRGSQDLLGQAEAQNWLIQPQSGLR